MELPMDTPPFAAFIAEERGRIHEAIKGAKAKRQQAERELTQLEAQLSAIAAYEAALKGTAAVKEAAGRRGRSGGKREELLKLIAEHPEGLTRAEVIAAMQAHGDKAATQSISNALAALKKAGRVVQEGKVYKMRE
jgi:hypothetical protein